MLLLQLLQFPICTQNMVRPFVPYFKKRKKYMHNKTSVSLHHYVDALLYSKPNNSEKK